MNGLKTFFLMLLMTLLLMFIGNAVGGRSGMQIAFGFAFLMNFISYWFSDKIVLAMYKAQPVEEGTKLYSLVKRVAMSADIPMPKVYMIEERQPNAFATGRNPKNAAVAVT
ncbi:MAG: M48 family metalloprotease, partial [Fusobacteriaceae bacterium]